MRPLVFFALVACNDGTGPIDTDVPSTERLFVGYSWQVGQFDLLPGQGDDWYAEAVRAKYGDPTMTVPNEDYRQCFTLEDDGSVTWEWWADDGAESGSGSLGSWSYVGPDDRAEVFTVAGQEWSVAASPSESWTAYPALRAIDADAGAFVASACTLYLD